MTVSSDDIRARVTRLMPQIRQDLEDLVRIESVSADPARASEVQRSAEAVAEPLADSGPMPMNHPGEELVIVTEGELVFTIDGEKHSVRAGDSIHFRTQLPHSWANPDETPARAIWLVVRSS